MEDYTELMMLLGFPRWHVEGGFINHIQGAMVNCEMSVYDCLPKARQYMKENKFNPLEYNYTECWQLADEFVRSNISPQFKDDDGEDDWYDEIFEMWQDVFAYLSESAYLQLYHINEDTLFKLIEKRKE